MATYTSNYGWTKPSGSDNVDISVLNDNLDDQDSTIHDAFLNMAPPFSESSTYAVDDIVLYTTGLYKCHTAVVTPGSWTGSTNWQVYKLSEGGSGGGGTTNYNALTNKPQINSVELSGNKTSAQLGLMASDGVVANPTGQTTGTLTALEVGGTKYVVPSGGGGTSDYTDLTNKPSINGVELSGNKTTSDLGIDKTAVGLGNVPNVSTNDQTPTFSQASTRNNIASGEKLSVILGKIQKFFNDLKTVAFSGSFTDLTNKPENANTFQGTIAEWNQLTTAEKKAYDHASIPDSLDGNVTFPASKVMLNSGDSVEEKIGNMRMTKLWENPDPTSNIDAGILVNSIESYDFYVVIARKYATTTNQKAYICRPGKNEITADDMPTNVASGVAVATRVLNFGTYVTITDCSFQYTGGKNTSNNYIIPTVIYGIKLT